MYLCTYVHAWLDHKSPCNNLKKLSMCVCTYIPICAYIARGEIAHELLHELQPTEIYVCNICYTYVCIYTYVYVYLYTYVYIYTCVYVYKYM